MGDYALLYILFAPFVGARALPQTYSYGVRDRQGKIISGKVEAENETSVSQRLREMGYF